VNCFNINGVGTIGGNSRCNHSDNFRSFALFFIRLISFFPVPETSGFWPETPPKFGEGADQIDDKNQKIRAAKQNYQYQ
jgi:hypothetical protein